MRPYYDRALAALTAVHDACFNSRRRKGALSMSHGSFSGVNEALGIIDLLERENQRLRHLIRGSAEAGTEGSAKAP